MSAMLFFEPYLNLLLAVVYVIPQAGSGPMSGFAIATLASSSATRLPAIPACPAAHTSATVSHLSSVFTVSPCGNDSNTELFLWSIIFSCVDAMFGTLTSLWWGLNPECY